MKRNWQLWRLVLSDAGFDYQTVFYCMTREEIEEANAALDLQIEVQEKRIEEERAKSRMRALTGRR